jgi:hypothetical protein
MNLTDFLIELASDPQKTAAFKIDPKKVMEEAGLSDADMSVLLSGEPEAIRQAVDQEKLGHHIVTIIFISVMISDPH